MNRKYINKTVLLIILITTLSGCLTPVKAENEATGFTVMSIDSVPIISNNNDLSKANFTLTLVANGGGQSIVGNFGNETFVKYLTNVVIQYPLKIEIGNIKENIKYPILNQGMLFKYEYHYIEAKEWWNGAKCDDSNFCFPINTNGFVIGPDRILAINKIPIGMYGTFGNPDVSWKGKIVVTINGIPYEKDIGDTTSGSVNFNSFNGEFVANAKWVGSLFTGQAPPSQDPYVPTYKMENKVWKIASKTYYDTYSKSLYETDTIFNTYKDENYGYISGNKFVYTCQDSICSNILNHVNVHNALLNTLTDSNIKIGYGSVLSYSSTITSKRENDVLYGNLVDTFDLTIGNPVIIFTVAARELHPYVTTGVPKIESVTSETFNSGDGNGVALIKVKNIGTSKGTFSAYLTEESETFKSQSNVESAKITLSPGESGTIKMYINYGSNLQNITKNGVVTVYDVNYPDTKTTSTKEFSINMDSPKVCEPNTYRIFSNRVYKCNNDGLDEIISLQCDNGLIEYVDGKYICKEISENINSYLYEEPEQITSNSNIENEESPKQEQEQEQKQKQSVLMTILYWLFVFSILTIIFITINKIRNDEPKITKQNIDKSLLLSGLITGIFYLFIQYVALYEALGLILWITVVIIIGITIIINLISYIRLGKPLSIWLSITISIGLFIIFTAILTGIKELMCDNWITSWLFSNCKKFDLIDYLFK